MGKTFIKNLDGFNIYRNFIEENTARIMVLSAYLKRRKVAEEKYFCHSNKEMEYCCKHLISVAKQNVSRT